MDKLLNLKNFPILDSNKTFNKTFVRLLYIFGANGSEVIFITNEDLVYCYGQNRGICLGLGHERTDIRCPELNRILSGKKVIDISSGCRHCIGLTSEGKCYGWGDNKSRAVGVGSLKFKLNPELITALDKIKVVQICCGCDYSMALTDRGRVYAWGRNSKGQLGYAGRQSVPVLVHKLISETVVSISCGSSHSMALTQDRRVYVWGSYRTGDLSLPYSGSSYINLGGIPRILASIEGIVIRKIVCGPHHSLILATDGSIYGFGNNSVAQIGNGSVDTQVMPIKIREELRFKDVFAYKLSNLSVGITHDNKFYVWGLVNGKRVLTPEQVNDPSLYSIYDVHAVFGEAPTTYKALVITTDLNNSTESNVITNKVINKVNQRTDNQRKVILTKNNLFIRLSMDSSDDEMEVNKTIVDNSSQKTIVSATEDKQKFGSNSQTFSSDLLQNLCNHSFNNPEDSDLKLIFNDKFIYCHKTVLKIRNNKFWQNCENQFKNGNTNEIRIKAVYYHSFFEFIKHLYGQRPEVDDKNCSYLLKLATIYDEKELHDMCTEYRYGSEN